MRIEDGSEALKAFGPATPAPGPWALGRRERAPLRYYLAALVLVMAGVFAVIAINGRPTSIRETDPPEQVGESPIPVSTEGVVTEQEYRRRETRPAVCDAPSMRGLASCQEG